MQHERETLGRAERVQHDLYRDPDRLGQQRLVLGIGPGRRILDDRLRPPAVERLLAAGATGPEQVQADPGDDRGQPPLEALDLLVAGPLKT